MKILMFGSSNYFLPVQGGGARYVHNIMMGLVNEGYEIEALTSELNNNKNGYENIDNAYQIHRYRNIKRLSSVLPTVKLFYFCLKGKKDLIFLSNLLGTHAIGVLLLNKIFKIPYAIAIAGLELVWLKSGFFDKTIARTLLNNAKCVFALSNYTKSRIKEFSHEDLPVKVSWPGIDTTLFRPAEKDQKVISKFDLRDKKVILSVSRLVKRKGHVSVLKAMSRVIKKIPNAVYVIAGDGEEKRNLERLTQELGVQNHVHFLGNVKNEDTPTWYNIADVFILTSYEKYDSCQFDFEGFGVVFLEANACGTPTIGGNSGGIRDAILDGETGFLVDPFNIEKIEDKLIDILSNNKLAEEMGKKGRKRVLKDFSYQIVGRRASMFLKGII